MRKRHKLIGVGRDGEHSAAAWEVTAGAFVLDATESVAGTDIEALGDITEMAESRVQESGINFWRNLSWWAAALYLSLSLLA